MVEKRTGYHGEQCIRLLGGELVAARRAKNGAFVRHEEVEG